MQKTNEIHLKLELPCFNTSLRSAEEISSDSPLKGFEAEFSAAMDDGVQNTSIRILCRRLLISLNKQQQGIQIQWLVGSPFFPPFTIVSTFRCIHTLPSNPNSPDFSKETSTSFACSTSISIFFKFFRPILFF